jgi:hypothetical protein
MWSAAVLTHDSGERKWMRERDSNPRPPGYEPSDLPLIYPAQRVYHDAGFSMSCLYRGTGKPLIFVVLGICSYLYILPPHVHPARRDFGRRLL